MTTIQNMGKVEKYGQKQIFCIGLSEQMDLAFDLYMQNTEKYVCYPEYVTEEDAESFPKFIKRGKTVKLPNSERGLSRYALDEYIRDEKMVKIGGTYSLEEILKAGKKVVMVKKKAH